MKIWIWIIVMMLKLCSCEKKSTADQYIIQESGMSKTDVGDIALVFYVTVKNPTSNTTTFQVMVNNCCVEEERHRMECDMMKLYGGYNGLIQPKATLKVDFIYPTLYSYDMVGHCSMMVVFNSTFHPVNITFNTTLVEERAVSWLPYFINELLFDIQIPRKCRSRDEDRFNDCSPVLCDIKYHGQRNFFDLERRLCVPVADCSRDDKSSKVYDSMTNTCKEGEYSGKTLKFIEEEDVENDEEEVNWRVEKRLDCNHGDLVTNRSMCICNHGYTSLVLPDQEIRNGVQQMCTLHDRGYIVTIIVGVALAAFVIAILHVANYTWKQQKKAQLSEAFTEGEYHTVMTDSMNQFSVDIYETELEYEKANLVRRCFRGLSKLFWCRKDVKRDYSMEDINLGSALLGPTSLEEDYEID